MGIKDWLKKQAEDGKKAIEEGTADAIMNEEMDPYGREHKGQPPGAPKKEN